MTAGLRALLAGLIDYAGLFPPAGLPLGEAVRNYRAYQRGDDAWMLGRFVCPAGRLGELPEVDAGPPLVVSALGRGGSSAGEWLANLGVDLAEIDACRRRHGGRVVVDALEVRVPGEGPLRAGLFDEAAERTASAALAMFFEAPVADLGALEELLVLLRETAFVRPAGYKMRTGGLEAAAFPTSGQLALAVLACAEGRVPWKATAGLHHPLPRWDGGAGARMHGFVNLFTAGVLAWHRLIGPAEACEVLEEEAGASFVFTDGGLRWRGHGVSVAQIEQARRQGAVSFGSCSFEEPREDLRGLGWM